MKLNLQIMLFLCLTIANTSMAATRVIDPLKYAEEHSKQYSEGDLGNSDGWEGCIVTHLMPKNIQIECEGRMTILAHGGHRSEVRFFCAYSFERETKRLFSINHERCE